MAFQSNPRIGATLKRHLKSVIFQEYCCLEYFERLDWIFVHSGRSGSTVGAATIILSLSLSTCTILAFFLLNLR